MDLIELTTRALEPLLPKGVTLDRGSIDEQGTATFSVLENGVEVCEIVIGEDTTVVVEPFDDADLKQIVESMRARRR